MIVDSSVLVAIIRNEDDARELLASIDSATQVSVSAATLFEASLVVTPALHQELDSLVGTAEMTVVPFDVEQARVARGAYARYGKSSGSRARLNFGDCFSYALAIDRREPLVFKGDDFRHTDVRSALE